MVPVRKIGENLYVQNLSLGPTAAFKDMALQPLALDTEYALDFVDRDLTILGATSGDTGPAAEAAFKDLDKVTLFMLSPEIGMSAFQKAQMGELSGGNIRNISIQQGRFDDCNELLGQIKSEHEFSDFGAVNSINWGRIVAQVPYYFAGYLQAVGDNIGQEVDFVVPTGNFGNVLAGHIARRMGLPIRELIVANNENDAMHTLVQTGEYVAQKSDITTSPSMDICKPKNYERLLYELLAGDGAEVSNYMEQFKEVGHVALREYGIPPTAIQEAGIGSGVSDHANRLDSIRWAYDATEGALVIDPHTADAVAVARRRSLDVPTICLSTALPVKFEPTVQEALGFVPDRPRRFQKIGQVANAGGFVAIENDLGTLASYLHSQREAIRAGQLQRSSSSVTMTESNN